MEEVSKFFHRESLLLKSRKLGKKKSKSEVERKTREVWVESRRVALSELSARNRTSDLRNSRPSAFFTELQRMFLNNGNT